MLITTVASIVQQGSGRRAAIARAAVLVVSFPLRMTLHYSSPPSRPMAVLILPDQSREGYEPAGAENEMLQVAGR